MTQQAGAGQQVGRSFFKEKRKFNYITLGLLAVVIGFGAFVYYVF